MKPCIPRATARWHESPWYPRIAASIALSFVVLATACGKSDAQAGASYPPPPDVDVATVTRETIRTWDRYTGRVSAVDTVEIRPRVTGYVQKVAYREGGDVREGDVMFLIDARPYQAALDAALARLQGARARASLARAQNERAASLAKAKAISSEERETRQSEDDQATAEIRAAEAAVALARLDVEYTQVRAPVSGRAGRANLTAGNMVQANVTALASVVSIDPVHVYFDCDENAYLRNAAARSGDVSVRVGLADETDYPHPARLDFLDNQVRPATGTIRARAVVPNASKRLVPGLFARVEVQAAPRQAILVNERALLTDQDHRYVYVVGDDRRAVRRGLRLGERVDGGRVVDSGLQAGEKVVVDGVQKIYFSGAPVTPHVAPVAKVADAGGSGHR